MCDWKRKIYVAVRMIGRPSSSEEWRQTSIFVLRTMRKTWSRYVCVCVCVCLRERNMERDFYLYYIMLSWTVQTLSSTVVYLIFRIALSFFIWLMKYISTNGRICNGVVCNRWTIWLRKSLFTYFADKAPDFLEEALSTEV